MMGHARGIGTVTRQPRVDILLLNWNGHRDTIACLESVLALDYPDFGIIVCDNASSDDSLDHISAWARVATRAGVPLRVKRLERHEAERGPVNATADLTLIQTGGNLGFAGGNNVGMAYLLQGGDCEFIWLVNNDCVVAPDSLTHLVATAVADPMIGVVGGTLLEFQYPSIVQEAGALSSSWHGMTHVLGAGQPVESLRVPGRVDYISGACLLARCEAIRRVGMLDERYFMYMEDADWGIRMRSSGFRLVLAPDAKVWHKGGSSTGHGSAMHDYFVVKSALLLVHKHHPTRLGIAFLYSMYRCMLPKVVRFQGKRLRAVLRAYREVARIITPRARRAPEPGSRRDATSGDKPRASVAQ